MRPKKKTRKKQKKKETQQTQQQKNDVLALKSAFFRHRILTEIIIDK